MHKPVNIDGLLGSIASFCQIEFVYEENIGSSDATERENEKNCLEACDISIIPKDLKKEAIKALALGDMTTLRKLVPKISTCNKDVGVAFGNMVGNYKLMELKRLFGDSNAGIKHK